VACSKHRLTRVKNLSIALLERSGCHVKGFVCLCEDSTLERRKDKNETIEILQIKNKALKTSRRQSSLLGPAQPEAEAMPVPFQMPCHTSRPLCSAHGAHVGWGLYAEAEEVLSSRVEQEEKKHWNGQAHLFRLEAVVSVA
jgi:hypothetical protein